MKEYTILIKDRRVQHWFNFLYDNAELGQTIEDLAKDHLHLADDILKKISDKTKN